MTKEKPQNKKKEIKKVHLIGICGVGMSALAILFKESGWQVTGSDENPFGPVPLYLEKNKIPFNKKFSGKNIPKETDLIIIGNNIPLAPEENEEKKKALELDVEIKSLPEALAMLSLNKENIVVVGSSGKSSMTGIIAWCLEFAKKDPSYFIGAMPIDLENSAHIGEGREFVLEGDEYTSSKTDRRSKFLHLNPTHVVLTSAAHDHVNIFPTEESYKDPYKKLAVEIPTSGTLVYALNGKNNKEIAKNAKCKTISYSLDDKSADWHGENVKYDMKTSFDLMRGSEKIVNIKTNLLGKHSIENIIGAGALLLENKKITAKEFAKAMAKFRGIKGRIELRTSESKVPVYEGFGSSYEKAKSIFDTMRLHFPNRRLVAIFEPHAFSWRNRKFLNWYKNIFSGVDEVVMLPAPSYGKKAEDQLMADEVWNEAKKYKDIQIVNNEKEAIEIVDKLVKEGDVVALVSSGSMLGLTESIPKLIKKKFPK